MVAEARRQLRCIRLDYGAEDPLLLEADEATVVADWRGPEGVAEKHAEERVFSALRTPCAGPPLAAHVVPGDRVAIALSGDLPQADAVVAAVVAELATAGVTPDDMTVVRAPPIDGIAGPVARPPKTAGTPQTCVFDPAVDSQTSYVAADAGGRPIHLARPLVDADMVVTIGGYAWDAAIGASSLEGELWPGFSRTACRQELVRLFARRGRRAVPAWRSANREAVWQLGVMASLRIVGGREDTLAAAAFGLPDATRRTCRRLARGWRPRVSGLASVSVVSLSHPRGGWGAVTRAIAAAARVTHRAGTICVTSRIDTRPGMVFSRWREGAPLEALVREAVRGGDPVLVADALQTRFIARALGERRLVILSDLDQTVVEDLDCGWAATPEAVERLAHRAESLAVLHEADRMMPRR